MSTLKIILIVKIALIFAILTLCLGIPPWQRFDCVSAVISLMVSA